MLWIEMGIAADPLVLEEKKKGRGFGLEIALWRYSERGARDVV